MSADDGSDVLHGSLGGLTKRRRIVDEAIEFHYNRKWYDDSPAEAFHQGSHHG